MTALKIISMILLIVLLIGFLRVGVIVSFGDRLHAKLRIGLIELTSLPKRKKKAKESPPEAAAPPEEQPVRKKRVIPKPTLDEIFDLVTTLFTALGATLRRTCKRLRIDPLEVTVIFGGRDPCDIAKTYGYANTAMWSLMPRAEELFYIPNPSLHLRMDYDAGKTTASGTVGISIRICDIFSILFTLAIPLLKWLLRFKKAHPKHADAQNSTVQTEQQSEQLTA